ncbi:hypothetical protein HYT55_05350 [Candidatus Woesearchaeota archaeon]|nr:hypothetical protein [Candidatus Woesearchaeota archaeon]
MKQVDLQNIDTFRTRHLLELASQAYAQSTRQIPKEKISKRIEELKYLTSQKSVPRLSIRKEVLHLEEQLQTILEVEKALQQQEKRESEKIRELKKQNELLRRRLAATEDKDLQKKVNRLSHLLADVAARKEIKRDVSLQQKKSKKTERQDETEPVPVASLTELEQRLESLKSLVDLKKAQGTEPQMISLLEDRVAQVEEKIKQLKQEKPIVKHTLLFHRPYPDTSTELPTPSVPRRT